MTFNIQIDMQLNFKEENLGMNSHSFVTLWVIQVVNAEPMSPVERGGGGHDIPENCI